MVLSHQATRVEEQVLNLLIMVCIEHEDDNVDQQRDDREEDKFLEIVPWWVTLDAALVHVKDQGSGVKHL